MEKKNANGVQTKASEGGAPKKQLPYSVETPYGFYLDLDFLKYVDDIEKGNTIKRVHIQRRIKGPSKFSTLPRNFSLPGHGVRPVPKEKDSTWSGTSTLGPKPKSRVAEVQQIFDFRASESVTSTQSNRAAVSPGSSFISAKPRDEAREGDGRTIPGQARPNLLRASSMPITLQQRKGSDSSSPDRTVGTPETGSTENVFRASPDITERRSIPQDRTGLHQQITVALKRVRELEEQVKTIPELKAQICSLREEREKLLLQLQAHVCTSPSTVVPSSNTETLPSGSTQATGVSECLPTKEITGKEKISVLVKESDINSERVEICSTHKETGGQLGQKSDGQTQPSEANVPPKVAVEHPTELTVQPLPQNVAGQESSLPVGARKDASRIHDDAVKGGKSEDSKQKLQEKLSTLEAKLAQASQELDRTTGLLKEQLQENKLKEEKILQLSEGVREEVCVAETHNRSRRESIDTGTETDKVNFANQETETESLHTADQGTDTDRICIEVHPPKERTGSIDHGTETIKTDTCEQVTEMDEGAAVSLHRPRANSMERGTVTERIVTQDQTTETPVAERINQVTETDGEMVTDHPQSPRASSVARGTEMERVDTVDRVTETVEAQMTDQQTETVINRQPDNPTVNAESQEVGSTPSQSESESTIVGERVKDEEVSRERLGDIGDSLTEVIEIKRNQTTDSDVETQEAAAWGHTDSKTQMISVKSDSETKETKPTKSEIPDILDAQPVALEIVDKTQREDSETLRVTVKEPAVGEKMVVPVRPQRGKKPAAEPAEPSTPQLQAAPPLPRRGSSEAQSQQPQPQSKNQPQAQIKGPPPHEDTQKKHPAPAPAQNEAVTKKSPTESGQKKPQSQPQTQGLSSGEGQKSQPLSQTSKPTRDSKELKATQKGSSLSQPPQRGESQARTTRQGSCDTQTQTQGSRKTPSEAKPAHKDGSDAQSLRRASGETAQRRGSSEAQASRRDSGDGQTPRRGSGESPTSPAALGQVVTRLTGLLGEQWAQLGSSSGAQQTAGQQESPGTHKQTAGKRAEASKGASAKPAGKAAPPAAAAAAAGKATGKPGPSKMSSIQSQLVSSLSVLSAFYSPGQKAAGAGKKQEQGLKSIMKKEGAADKQGNKRAKKNLKFVGVNGGYESTSSEESSGEEKPKAEVEEENSSEPEEETEKKTESEPAEKPVEEAEAQQKDVDVPAAEGGASGAEQQSERGLMDPEVSSELLEDQAEGEKVDKRFIDACVYVKDRMEEVSSPDKEMRQVLVALYQEWFRVSSQKDSQADTVRSYLRQVSLTTPTLLPYVVNLTDGNGNMALHYCVSHSNFPVVKLLLDTGLCETDNMNKAGYTPVMLAALTAADSSDDLEVAQQLLKLGNVDTRSRQAGQTALMLAVSHGRVAMVKLLLSCAADVNLQDYEGSTALMCASEHGHTHIVGLLLETGRCDLSLTDKNGQTAQKVAAGSSHQDIVDLLKAHAKASPPADLL
ncbi:KN motif and ankyrin repeat domain-containing protein 4 [Takifugu rubripes]|uniref:KN motif and ankyrin repeat domains 4 n=1 Tax=Takifugu rubripes TaxID=31033 RepID=A0A3B5KMC4_TAKRU|nr:KN motif and ankyrin repeat domain-containing protein 4 [Takifugu rubripes]XP_011613417.2 KN motif and ankyrin repeat domain-containing protein 4 [Takifugu rubripes]XP_011613418.2 KN motif and ankyrin repeat domain-containing protein 4 [Takifugu rubripes]